MPDTSPKSIDSYLKDVNPSQKEILEKLRKLINETVPNVEETISWDMPTFKYKNHNLIHFAAFQNHMSLFPGSGPIEDLKDELKDFTISKGTIQFTEDKLIPEATVKKILRKGMEAIDKKN